MITTVYLLARYISKNTVKYYTMFNTQFDLEGKIVFCFMFLGFLTLTYNKKLNK